MKTRDVQERQPIASRAVAEALSAQESFPQRAIDQSPRVLTQRRAIDATFGAGVRRAAQAAEPVRRMRQEGDSPTAGDIVQRVGEEDWVDSAAAALGVGLTQASSFIQYLLRSLPPAALPALITGGAVLAFLYLRFMRGEPVSKDVVAAGSGTTSTGKGGASGSGPVLNREGRLRLATESALSEDELASDDEQTSGEEWDSDEGEGSGDDFELETGASAENGAAAFAASLGRSGYPVDFQWVKGKATRDRKLPLTGLRLLAWDEFRQDKPKPRKGKSGGRKKKLPMNQQIFKSRQDDEARARSLIPDEPAFDPYRRIALAGTQVFAVDTMKAGTGTKSSSLAGAAGTKPLAVVYGRFSSNGVDFADAEVHVHFNDTEPVDSHTGAHVKQAGSYPYSWGSGNASADVALSAILNLGFPSQRWKLLSTYR